MEAGGRHLWVALDTRRGRIFLAQDRGRFETVAMDALPQPSGPVMVAGDAAEQVTAALRAMGVDAVASPARSLDPADVGRAALRRLAGALPPLDTQPLYVDAPAAREAASLRPAPR
jgi:tRNA threonylcarbamoyladenosine biosynthesis protein TsaB